MYDEQVLKILEKHKEGRLRKDLMDDLQIGSDKTSLRRFNTVIRKLDNKLGKVNVYKIPKVRIKDKEKDSKRYKRTVYYLPEYKETVYTYWRLQPQVHDFENIYASCLFVQDKVLTNWNGYLTPFEKEKTNFWEEVLPLSLLSVVLKYKGDSDLIVFLVDNKGTVPIKGVKASLNIDPRIRKPSNEFFNELCTIRKHSNRFNIECDELYPNDTAYLIVPLTKDKLNFEVTDEKLKPTDEIWEITGWYQDKQFRVREGSFTKDDLGFDCTIVDWRKEVTSP